MSDRDAFRAEQQARRDHGLKARHETREARAVRREIGEEIAQAIEAQCIDPDWPNDEISRNGAQAAAIAREIGARE